MYLRFVILRECMKTSTSTFAIMVALLDGSKHGAGMNMYASG